MPFNNTMAIVFRFLSNFHIIGCSAPPSNENDVVVFNYPIEDVVPVDHRSFYIKRCIGLPGDTRLKSMIKKYLSIINFCFFLKTWSLIISVQTDKSISYDSLAVYDISEGSYFGNESWELTLSNSVKKIESVN